MDNNNVTLEISEIKEIFATLKRGQSVYCQTEKQELLGRLHHVDRNLNFIFLDVVKDVKANVEYTSRQMIPAEMVKSIRALSNTSDTPSTSDSPCSSNNETLATSLNDLTVSLSPFEIQSLQNRIDNPVIINQSGTEYVKAMADLKSQPFIALFIEPTKYGRNFKTTVIAAATAQNVYIFDLVSLGKLFSDFKNLLESEIPRKAIHCSHLVVDHLKYQHDVNLNGIFDTFAAYCIVTKQKRHIDFVDIVEQFFSIDKKFFNTVIDDTFYPHNTFQRPMSREFITDCAKRVCLILKLQEHLQNKMLSKFYNQCKDFSRTFMEYENYALATRLMQTNTSAGLEKITELDARDQTI